jgi:hypothetical protein
MTLALSGAAYYLYRKGLPGSPHIENQVRAGSSVIERARIAALVPPGTITRTTVAYRLGPDKKQGRGALVYLYVIAPSDIFYAGLYLGGDAAAEVAVPTINRDDVRMIRTVTTHSTVGVPALDSIYDSQLTLFQIRPEAMHHRADGRYATTIGLEITMRLPAFARENARIAVSTPRLIRARSCTMLDGLRNDAPLRDPDLHQPQDLGCSEIRDRRSSEQSVSLELPALDMRIDYLYPQPRDPGRLHWRTLDDLSVQASLAAIAEEARGQQWLFLSGVAAGVAAGLAPLAIEMLVTRRTRHRPPS